MTFLPIRMKKVNVKYMISPLKELWPEEEYCAPRDKGYVTRWGEAYYNNIKKKTKEFINNARQS